MAEWFWLCLSLGFYIALMYVITEHNEEFLRIMDNEMTVALLCILLLSIACLFMGGQL